MGVRVRFWKDARWIFINHRGQRKSKRVGDRTTAESVAKVIRQRLATGDLRLERSDGDTLATYAARWLAGLSGNLNASTIRFYDDHLRRHILPALGQRLVSAITRADCRELVATLRAKGLKVATVAASSARSARSCLRPSRMTGCRPIRPYGWASICAAAMNPRR